MSCVLQPSGAPHARALCCMMRIRSVLTNAGVWDVFGPNEAVELVMEVAERSGSAFTAAEQLCREAVDRAIDSEDGEADNTSAVVVIFRPSQ